MASKHSKSDPLPKDIAALIDKTWPDGMVEQFDREESYFWRGR